MKRLGIIQPGKIGDIVICLPIAKWYNDRGYEVIWPVDKNIIDNFIGYVDYVKFIPTSFDSNDARQLCYRHNCNTIIDTSFCTPNANIWNTDFYKNHNNKFSFDELKYHIADVPFTEKWNLQITRNIEKETQLYNALIDGDEKYVLLQEHSSDTTIKKTIETSHKIVNIIPRNGYGVFDWLTMIEKCHNAVLIASSFTNIIDQLYPAIANNKLYVIMKPGYDGKPLVDGHLQGFPRLKNNWIKT